jgi:MFS family permease
MSAAAFMTALDAMVVAAALPALRDDLHAPVESLQWTVSAYNLCFAVCLMTGSALGERLGRRRVLAAGLLAFVGGSIGCALSSTLAWLVAWRSVQGVASALIAPVAMAILSSTFAGPQRARALGLFGSITGLALIAGPALGGAVTQGLGWPWVFWINVPIGLGLAFLVQRRIVDGGGAPAPIDATGALLLVVAALGLAWALLRGQVVGWRTLEAAGSAAAGAAFLAGLSSIASASVRPWSHRGFSPGAGSPGRWPPARRCTRRSTAPCSCCLSFWGRRSAQPSSRR